MNRARNRTKFLLLLLITLSLFTFFYILGSNKNRLFGRGDIIARKITQLTKCNNLTVTLTFQIHRQNPISKTLNLQTLNSQPFPPCHQNYTDYIPCFSCPKNNKKLNCLIPAPNGYVAPFHWPKSREFIPYATIPYTNLTGQNWVRLEGEVFRVLEGGMIRYIDELAKVVPVGNGTVRTVLDIGCGVCNFGAYLMDENALTISLTEQVQISSERGLPSIIVNTKKLFDTKRLPFPSRSFDMIHCYECLVNWTSNDGMYMMEIDRVLRPGGFWILSDIKNNFRHSISEKMDLEMEMKKIEKIAKMLCWEKIYEVNKTMIWKKKEDDNSCPNLVKICEDGNEDDVWYKKMEACKILNLKTQQNTKLKPFPKRLYSIPPRISSKSIPHLSPNSYINNNKLWQKRVKYYKNINKYIGTNRYRNIMDMNSGTGAFNAALESERLWVMNVVPVFAGMADLGVVYERGLIGIYHDWCEAFSTYPRTYDLIHADGIFTMYKNKCKMEEILLEMDRILRPEGSVIIRDKMDILMEVKNIAKRMRWNTEMKDNEEGPHSSEKVLFAVKQYWISENQKC